MCFRVYFLRHVIAASMTKCIFINDANMYVLVCKLQIKVSGVSSLKGTVAKVF